MSIWKKIMNVIDNVELETQTFEDMKLKDGSIIRFETLEVGQAINAVTPDGLLPLPTGDYELEDGTILKVEDGKIIEITAIEAPIETPQVEAPVEAAEEVPVETPVETAPDIKMLEEKISMLEEKIAKLEEMIGVELESDDTEKFSVNQKLTKLAELSDNSKIEGLLKELNKRLELVEKQPATSSTITQMSNQKIEKSKPSFVDDLEEWTKKTKEQNKMFKNIK